MVDHCGQGLFHHIAWQNRPIQIITVGGPGYLGIWEFLLNIPGTPSPDQQFSRATILAYDGQIAVVRHYPHLLSPISEIRRCRRGSGWNWAWRILREHEGIVSGSEVNRLIARRYGERLPSIDLAHVDLSRCE